MFLLARVCFIIWCYCIFVNPFDMLVQVPFRGSWVTTMITDEGFNFMVYSTIMSVEISFGCRLVVTLGAFELFEFLMDPSVKYQYRIEMEKIMQYILFYMLRNFFYSKNIMYLSLPNMLIQVSFGCSSIFTESALIGFYFAVYSFYMSVQISFCRWSIFTFRTLEWFEFLVNATDVNFEISFRGSCIFTFTATLYKKEWYYEN